MIDSIVQQKLSDVYRRGDITLFLGAGVSAGSGLPTWSELVASMCFRYMEQEEWGRIQPYPNYLYAISKWYMTHLGESLDIVVRNLKSGWTEEEYHRNLWESLYSSRNGPNESFEPSQDNMIMDYICELIMKGIQNGKIHSIVTYNYDDLLDLELLNRKPNDIQIVFDGGKKIEHGKLPIYHVHGYIPSNDNPDKTAFGKVVLTESDYHALANDPNSWNNLIQLTSLASTTTIMVGLSLTDRNLRRILNITAIQPNASENYVFLPRLSSPQLTEDDIASIDKEASRIADVWNSNPYMKKKENLAREVNTILKGVMMNYAQNSEKLLEQMCITPIWYDTYDDIATYLHHMGSN